MDCVFCKIAEGTIPAKKLYEDDEVLAFADVAPQAPVHILVIPRQHVVSLGHTAREDAPLLGRLLTAAAELGSREGQGNGFRIVINTGRDGGQTVSHLHLHVLGGRAMHWPPG